jgi:hypothetical protein
MNNTGKAATLAGTAVAILLAGCAASTTTTGTGARGTTVSTRSARATPEQICLQAFGSAVLLDWGGGTVADFRAYQHGGPKPIIPLAHAFPGVPGSTPGAWCGTKDGPQTTQWWAAVPGHKPGMLITITGPGEGVKLGSVSMPPYVP